MAGAFATPAFGQTVDEDFPPEPLMIMAPLASCALTPVGGTITVNRSDTYTFGAVISGAGSVQQKGPGTLILSADQTYTGGTTVSGGALQIGNGGATGSVVGDILNNGAVAFNRSDAYAYGGVISGSGTMTQNGPGTVILTGDNTYAGLGAEVDFKRAANNYNGVSQIPGLPVFSLAHGGAWNGARPAANGGLFYNITPNQRVFLNGAAGQQAYTTRGYASGMLGYQAAF